MTHNDLTFFTNEPEHTLYDRFKSILKSNTQFFDVLVGYFRTSGFHRLYSAMEGVEKIRVLVGLNVDKKTIDIINEAEYEITLETLSHKEAKEAFSKATEYEFNISKDSLEIEKVFAYSLTGLKAEKLRWVCSCMGKWEAI